MVARTAVPYRLEEGIQRRGGWELAPGPTVSEPDRPIDRRVRLRREQFDAAPCEY